MKANGACNREFFGRANWEHPSPPTIQLLNPHFEGLDQDYVSIHIPPATGEMIVELHERVRNALEHIITTLDNEPEQPKTVLLCTHAATIIAAGRVLTGKMPDDPDEEDFHCYTAGLSKFIRKATNAGKGVAGDWVCVLDSETSYLSGGAERGWYGHISFYLDTYCRSHDESGSRSWMGPIHHAGIEDISILTYRDRHFNGEESFVDFSEGSVPTDGKTKL